MPDHSCLGKYCGEACGFPGHMCNGTGQCVFFGVPLNCNDETKSLPGNALYSMYKLPWKFNYSIDVILFCHNGVNFIITAPCPNFQDEDGNCIGKQISSLAIVCYLIKCV